MTSLLRILLPVGSLLVLIFSLTSSSSGSFSARVLSLDMIRDGQVVSISTAYEFAPGMFLTSAHSVRDQSAKYRIDGRYIVNMLTDGTHDRAVVSYTDSELYFPKLTLPEKSETIYASLLRDGKNVILTGSVLEVTGSMMGYTEKGIFIPIHDVLLTNIQTQRGDSGAPLLDGAGNLLDVVHIVGQ